MSEEDNLIFFTSRNPTTEQFKKDTSKNLKGTYLESNKFIALLEKP